MKAGWKTSEFWMAAAASAIALVAVLLGLSQQDTEGLTKAVDGGIAAVVALVTQATIVYRYVMSRELLKLANAPDPEPTVLPMPPKQ